ncbi:MAG: hypothetical protein WCB94_04225 [Terriglobales bacterium]
MRPKIEIAVLVVALMVGGMMPCLVSAQGVPLADQLQAQYTLVKMGADTGGAAVVDQGTILVIKKGGILGVPYSDRTVLTTKYEGGTVHSPSTLMTEGRKRLFGHFSQTQSEGQTTHLFAAGDKVYPSKVEVNLAKDNVTIGIIACDTCNKTDPPTYNKAQVVFQFPAGTLAKANPSQVEDKIAELLAIDDSGGDQGGEQQGGNGNDQQGGGNQQGGGGGQAQQQAPPPEPEQIAKGQTPDQVKASLGTPEKIVNLGPKQIYVYKDLKVTFLNGKVSDVQ